MGNCFSADEETKMNKKISKEMDKAATEKLAKVSLLILGTGDSGKTTLRKQLVNVHSNQFENAGYRLTFASVIIGNLIDNTIAVLENIGSADETVNSIKDQARAVGNFLPPAFADQLCKVIWDDSSFMDAARKPSSGVQIQDCFFNFAEELKNNPGWGREGWTPSVEDCVRARVRTSGVIQEEVTIEGVNFLLYDVGGQRAERRKWMHSFDFVTAAIFVCSISEYDQTLFEDRSKNRLQEGFDLFYECMNSTWLDKTTTILFLNKKDLFDKKFLVDKVPLNVSGLFPTAPTGNDDAEAAIKWISDQFKSKRLNKKSDLVVHVTTATDPNNVKKVFKVCKDLILRRNMEIAGFVSSRIE